MHMQAHFRTLLGNGMSATGCSYIYDMRQCKTDPEENNYENFVMYNTTRKAIHVGNRKEEFHSFVRNPNYSHQQTTK